jgi:hypothetical protein
MAAACSRNRLHSNRPIEDEDDDEYEHEKNRQP